LIDALRIEARGRPAGRQRQREAKEKAEDYYPQGGCPLLLAWTTIMANWPLCKSAVSRTKRRWRNVRIVEVSWLAVMVPICQSLQVCRNSALP